MNQKKGPFLNLPSTHSCAPGLLAGGLQRGSPCPTGDMDPCPVLPSGQEADLTGSSLGPEGQQVGHRAQWRDGRRNVLQ